MIRLVNIGLFLCLLILITGVYFLKSNSKTLQKDIWSLKHKIENAQSNSDVLRAEIAHLENPERLFRLAKQYLNLEPYNDKRSLNDETFRFVIKTRMIKEGEE